MEMLSERYDEAINNILDFIDGKPLKLLNPEVTPKNVNSPQFVAIGPGYISCAKYAKNATVPQVIPFLSINFILSDLYVYLAIPVRFITLRCTSTILEGDSVATSRVSPSTPPSQTVPRYSFSR